MTPSKEWYLGTLFHSSRLKGVSGLPILSVTLHNGLIVRSSLDRRTETNIDAEEHLLIEEGCLAYNMMRIWQGALGRASFDGLVSPAYIVLKPTEDIDSKYAEYLFKTPRMIYLFWAYSYGLTKDRLRLYYKDFARILVSIPSVSEQRKTAKILSTWDKAITTTERLIDNSKQQKKVLMQQLLTGKKQLLDDSGKPFEGDWETLTIGNLGAIYSGGTPSTSTKEYWDGGVDWVTPTDITKQNSVYIHSSKRKISSEGVKNSSAKLVPKGSLLVCTRATIGEMAITAHEMCTNQGFKNIVPNNKSNIEFLFYLLTFEKHKLVSKASGSTFLELSKSAFESMNFNMPKVDEQQKIAAVLTNADKEIGLLEQQLSDLKKEKKALMQQLLTGKRRVLI